MPEFTAHIYHIQPSSGLPIYKQLVDQIHILVSSGFLKAGDGLPSVRQTAEYLAVNPMTISKAYSLLEATGVLERVRGKGMIISTKQKKVNDLKQRLELVRPALEDIVRQAGQLALPKELLLKEFRKLLEDKQDE